MKPLSIFLSTVLLSSVLFLAGYLLSEHSRSYSSGTALIARFVKPQETHLINDLLTKLPSEKVSYPKLATDGHSIIYYDSGSGYLHKIELSNTANKNLTLQKIRPYLRDLQWSWDHNLLLASDGTDNLVFDFNLNTSRILPPNILNPVFSRFSDRAGYVQLGPEETSAAVGMTDTRFTFFKKLLSAQTNSWYLDWIAPKTLALIYENGPGSSLFLLNSATSQLTRVLNNQPGLEVAWAPDGSAFLYSTFTTNDAPKLFYYNLASGQASLLPQSAVASRCTWSIDNQTAYCAFSADSNDGFFQFDTKTAALKVLKNDTSVVVKAADLFLSADENSLFFRNAVDGTLYRLKITF